MVVFVAVAATFLLPAPLLGLTGSSTVTVAAAAPVLKNDTMTEVAGRFGTFVMSPQGATILTLGSSLVVFRFDVFVVCVGVVFFVSSLLFLTRFSLGRDWGIRLLGCCAAMYAGLYLVEYASYTTAAKERKFKHLFVQHMTAELKAFARHTCPDKVGDLSVELQRQLGAAKTHVSSVHAQMEADLAAGQTELIALESAAAKAFSVGALFAL
jgi:hypothetical protein